MGPLWDFDLAFGLGNGNAGSEWALETDGFALSERASWFIRLFEDNSFVEKVKERYNYYYGNKQLILDRIDNQSRLLKGKVINDNSRWGTVCDPSSESVVETEYQKKVDALKLWIDTRMEWLKTNLENL